MSNTPYKARKVLFDKKLSVIAYAVTLVAAVIARTNQLRTNMEFATGKYKDPNMSDMPVTILLIGMIVISVIMIFGKSKDKAIKTCILVNPMRLRAERLNKKLPLAAAVFLFITAGLIGFDIIYDIAKVAKVNIENSTAEHPIFILTGISAKDLAIYACGLIVAVTFITMGINIFKGDGFSKGNSVFLMFYPLWKQLIIMDMMFASNKLINAYSEKKYILLTAIVSSMFYIYAARLFGGFEQKHTRITMCILGYFASLLAAVSVIPRYICMFVMSYHEREGMALPEASDIGIILVPVAIVCVFWTTYVYRVMPKLSFSGKRRWMKTTLTGSTMETLDKDTGETR